MKQLSAKVAILGKNLSKSSKPGQTNITYICGGILFSTKEQGKTFGAGVQCTPAPMPWKQCNSVNNRYRKLLVLGAVALEATCV